MEMKSYVYQWIDKNGDIYYVGKGCNHRDISAQNHPVKRPNTTIIRIKENMTEQQAIDLEDTIFIAVGKWEGTGTLENKHRPATDFPHGILKEAKSEEMKKKWKSPDSVYRTSEYHKRLKNRWSEERKTKWKAEMKRRWKNGDYNNLNYNNLKRKKRNQKKGYLSSRQYTYGEPKPISHPEIKIQNIKKGIQRNSTTGFRGVMKSGDYFKAHIKNNSQRTWLGTYETASDCME